MADRLTNRELRAEVQQREAQYRHELLTVVWAVAFGMLLLSLISYHPHDHTLLSYASDEADIANWCGAVGANLAALAFYFLGSAAYLVAVAMVVGIIRRWRQARAEDEAGAHKNASRIGRCIAWTLTMVAAASLLACYHIDVVCEVAGGLIGSMSYRLLALASGPVGSQLLLWATLWIALSVLARLPLMPLIKRLLALMGRGCASAWAWCKGLVAKKPVEQAPVVIAGAVKDEPCDDAFWSAVTGETITDEQAIADGAAQQPTDGQAADVVVGLDSERVALLAQIALRREMEPRKVLNATIARLPNSVLTHHLFVAVEGDQMPYACIVQAVGTPKRVERRKVVSTAYRLPDVSLFNPPVVTKSDASSDAEDAAHNEQRACKVEEKLEHFGVNGKMVSIKPGPVVTLFEYKPEIDSKISKIIALEDDLAMALTAHSLRIIAPIPGKNAVGFEIANQSRRDVVISSVLSTPAFQETRAKLPLILGVDALGNPVVEDLTTMPHLLVGGATGSGKSVGLNVMVVSLLCKRSPDDLRLIMIDPKRLEFTPYANIPHLLFPIVTQPTRAAGVLSWVVQEMEERYESMAAKGVRSFDEYRKLMAAQAAEQGPAHAAEGNERNLAHRSAYLAVVIDELADLMMVAGKEVEEKIVRIAQMARAAGIHLVVATQRPSVDVVTGLIKVNFPSRVSFRVSSKVDSRTILDQQGAEKLLGRGDMLYMHASSPELKRVHGPYVADMEIERLTNVIRVQREPQYLDLNDVLKQTAQRKEMHEQDELYPQLLELIKSTDEISISMIQRHYRIGFNRSARLIERLELDGLLAPAQGSKPRKVIR